MAAISVDVSVLKNTKNLFIECRMVSDGMGLFVCGLGALCRQRQAIYKKLLASAATSRSKHIQMGPIHITYTALINKNKIFVFFLT